MADVFYRILARFRIYKASDPHAVYRFLNDLRLEDRPIAVAKFITIGHDIYWPNWLKRPLALAIDHLALAVQIIAGVMKGRVVIVREFKNRFLPLLLPIAWPLRARLILNVNANLPQTPDQRWHHLVTTALSRLGFRLMLLDGKEVRSDLAAAYPSLRLLTPYFGIADRRRPQAEQRPPDGQFVVGFVGYFYPSKGGLSALAEAIRALKAEPGVRVALGYWNKPQADALPADVTESIDLVSTHRYDDYSNFIHACDALVVMAPPNQYNFRHSGILVDALSRGVPAICPNGRLLSFQVSAPVPVGVTYGSLAELPAAVKRVRQRKREFLDNFDVYFAARSTAVVEAELASEWNLANQAPAPAAAVGVNTP